jgi:hypothetical protein
MNEQNPNSPIPPQPPGRPSGVGATPPRIPPGSWAGYQAAPEPLGTNPVERTPIQGVIGAVEAILRQPRRVMFQMKQPNAGGLIISLLAIAVVCSLVYGVVVGTFSGAQQYWAAPVKIACGMLISALICLPSLYIFACLSGSQARLAEMFGLVAGLMALLTVLLIGFAPVAWVFSESTHSVVVMGSLHLAFWFVAAIFGLRFLHAAFCHLNAKTSGGFQVWVAIFLLVALQMTTALRPLVGKSDRFLPAATEKKFFVQHWLDCVATDPTWNETPPKAPRQDAQN